MSSAKPTFLVVDDKRNMVRLMAKVLKNDATVRTATDGGSALRILASESVDVVLCDLKMPDMDGLDVLKACRRLRPSAGFVLMTAYATVGTAVEALKLGAYDYLTKPFEPEDARAVMLRAWSRVTPAVTDEETALSGESDEVLPGVIARSPAMKGLASLVKRVADSSVTTLILGETGTGKERIARAVHELSPRQPRRMVSLNCAAIPAELLESELFGHAKGAFTGAVSERKGLFEEAHKGSLFLDEIGDLRPSLQAKLTRVLEEGLIRRVGESKERKVDVRVIAATHQNLEKMVEAGTFREDLWYRLNVASLKLPPLRERREDVEILVRHFLREQAERVRSRAISGFSEDTLAVLLRFPWPGNVRQLRSVVERACVVSLGPCIGVQDLPAELLSANKTDAPEFETNTSDTWAQAIERGRVTTGQRYLEALLKRFEGKVSDAAEQAGVERESFYRLCRKNAVDPAEYRSRKS
ncbi:MAG: sigma-54-dependent Fis family transcriptional regulator [Deltaproteobacteria bacterium]|nr:sigma-54-dependent Fis family transcriptional regulator [Deltaproteobacteria bacterium]